MNETKTVKSGGVSFCGLLAIAFIVLKLCKVIDWSWWWVLSPLWIPAAAVLLSTALVLAIALVAMIAASRK